MARRIFRTFLICILCFIQFSDPVCSYASEGLSSELSPSGESILDDGGIDDDAHRSTMHSEDVDAVARDVDDAQDGALSDDEAERIEGESVAEMSAQAAAYADVPAPVLSFATSDGAAVALAPQRASGRLYYFLPSGVSLTSVTPDFNLAEGASASLVDAADSPIASFVSGSTINLNSALRDVAATEKEFTLKVTYADDSSASTSFRVMQSNGVASVFLTSADPVNQGREYIESRGDHSTKAPGSLRVLSSGSSERYSGEFSAIKGRGNTSWKMASKKSYQVKLNKKEDLLESVNHEGATEKSKKWLLIANAFDPTLMRNEMTYQLAKDIGLSSSPDTEVIDLYYDGEYRGMYLLTEKVEIGSGRVEINDLESDIEDANPGVDLDALPTRSATTTYGSAMQYVSGIKEPADITGGYLLELDGAYYSSEKSWFKTCTGHAFVSKSPEYLSKRQMDYVSNIMNDALLCLMNGGTHPKTGKQLFDYFDKDSLVRYFFVEELAKNADGFISSTFFYIPEGQTKVFTGPVWDFDGTYGIRNELASFKNTSSWLARDGFDKLLSYPGFKYALYDIYENEIKNHVSTLLQGTENDRGSIAYYSAKNNASRMMNSKIWGLSNSFPLMTSYSSYEASLSAMRSWLEARAQWMDSTIGTYSSFSSEDMAPMYRLYNRVTGEHLYTASAYERDVLARGDWNYEGIGWYAPRSGDPVYRLWNGNVGEHHYTTSAYERDYIVKYQGWTYEGIGWYSSGPIAVYRLYNPDWNMHHYTTSSYERDYISNYQGWNYEGLGWYGL